jgi:hypothetical protein
MLSVIYAKCNYAECHYAECHYAECHYAECHYAECHFADCHYAVYRYAEWRGILDLRITSLVFYHCSTVLQQNTRNKKKNSNVLRLIYTSDFKLRFRIKLAHFREYILFVCLANLQA